MKSRSQQIAQLLLDLGAVSIRPDDPFRWASGLWSPIYCDNRMIISDVAGREQVASGLIQLISEHDWEPHVIAGTATAGIPHAAWVAQALFLPMVYVRSNSKAHGRQNQIEGRLEPGQRVVLIEDLISTGGSSIQAAQALQQAKGDVLGIAAVFEYGLKQADRAFSSCRIARHSLCRLIDLIQLLESQNKITPDQRETMTQWQEDPQAWSDRVAQYRV